MSRRRLLVRRAQLAGAYRRRHDLEHFGRDLADVEHRIAELKALLPAGLIDTARRLGEPSTQPAARGFGG